jgi:hypothetical protein
MQSESLVFCNKLLPRGTLRNVREAVLQGTRADGVLLGGNGSRKRDPCGSGGEERAAGGAHGGGGTGPWCWRPASGCALALAWTVRPCAPCWTCCGHDTPASKRAGISMRQRVSARLVGKLHWYLLELQPEVPRPTATTLRRAHRIAPPITRLRQSSIEWSYQNTKTNSCTRNAGGSLTCVADHPNGFEWCVNSPAIDANGVVYANSEDGNPFASPQGGSPIRQDLFSERRTSVRGR